MSYRKGNIFFFSSTFLSTCVSDFYCGLKFNTAQEDGGLGVGNPSGIYHLVWFAQKTNIDPKNSTSSSARFSRGEGFQNV